MWGRSSGRSRRSAAPTTSARPPIPRSRWPGSAPTGGRARGKAARARGAAERVADLPRRDLDEAGRAAVLHGRPVPRDSGLGARGSGFEADVPSPESRAPSPVALFAAGQLVAVADRVGELLKPRVVVGEE